MSLSTEARKDPQYSTNWLSSLPHLTRSGRRLPTECKLWREGLAEGVEENYG